MIFSIEFIYALGAALLVSLLSLVGLVYLFFSKTLLVQCIPFVVALATGILLGNAFFHLIPESLHQGPPLHFILGSILLGLLIFWIFDRFLAPSHALGDLETKPVKSIGMLNLIGDGFHNFIDGLVIGGSFLISPELGMATTVAILIHELPQELGDTGTLIFSGYTPKQVVKLNFAVSTSVILGVAFVFLLNQWIFIEAGYLLGFTAGGFIYMAVANLIPSLFKQARGNIRLQVFHLTFFLIGLGFIQFISQEHTHSHDTHQHGKASHVHPMGLIFRE
jgi:zinc and cadmium transporter